MTPERFQRELRRQLYSSMSVRRDRTWSARHGFHPDSLLVWDVAPVSGEPYVVFVCQRRGVPMEPNQEMLDAIKSMDFERIHRGRKWWAREVAGEGDRMNESMERKRLASFKERFDWDFTPWATWATRNHRTYGLNGAMVPR